MMTPMDLQREDERLNLSRRSFFFFGAILAAKPMKVIRTHLYRPRPLMVSVTIDTIPTTPHMLYYVDFVSKKGELVRVHGAMGGNLVAPVDSVISAYGTIYSGTPTDSVTISIGPRRDEQQG